MNRVINPILCFFLYLLFVVALFVIIFPYIESRESLKATGPEFAAAQAKMDAAIIRMRTQKEVVQKNLSLFFLSAEESERVRIAICGATDKTLTVFHVLRLIETESNGDPKAIGRHGEKGLMQILPWIAKPHLAKLGKEDLFDPVANVQVGMMELRRLLKIFDSNLGLALAAYNRGPTRSLYYSNRILEGGKGCH